MVLVYLNILSYALSNSYSFLNKFIFKLYQITSIVKMPTKTTTFSILFKRIE